MMETINTLRIKMFDELEKKQAELLIVKREKSADEYSYVSGEYFGSLRMLKKIGLISLEEWTYITDQTHKLIHRVNE